ECPGSPSAAGSAGCSPSARSASHTPAWSVPLHGRLRGWTDAIGSGWGLRTSRPSSRDIIWMHPMRGGRTMPQAVIVATARSPIGRAGKGSLTSIRADDLAAQTIAAALAKVPQLDPADVGDLILGCGLPGGEQGFNMARVVAVLLGHDHLPGTTVNRYCSSSLQTTRMAFHAIKAGEGDVYISAGVECVSRTVNGTSDPREAVNPLFANARDRT